MARLIGRASPISKLTVAWVILVTALGLGLISSPGANASCVGPQLGLRESGSSVAPQTEPPSVGTDPSEHVVHDVRAGERLRINGSYLTRDCFDTGSSVAGCSGPPTTPRTPAPINGDELILTQGGQHWTLIENVPVQSDLTAQLEVTLPAGLHPGPAQLILRDASQVDTQLELRVS